MKKNKIIKYIGLCLLLGLVFVPEVNAAGFKFANKNIQCGGVEFPYGVAYIVGNIVDLIKIAVPILLIVMGMVDFLQAVIANDEKQMKEKTNKFIKRILAAVIVFFVVAIVQFVFGEVISDGEGKDALSCVSCFLGNDNSCRITEVVDKEKYEYNEVINNDTDCNLTYGFSPANHYQNKGNISIKFESNNCKFEVVNTICKWEDENGGDLLTGTCTANKASDGTFNIGANFSSVETEFKVTFENGQSTTVSFDGDPYSIIEGKEK